MATSVLTSSNSSERTVLCTTNHTQMYRNRGFFSLSPFTFRCNFVNDSFHPSLKSFPTKLEVFPSLISMHFMDKHIRMQPKL